MSRKPKKVHDDSPPSNGPQNPEEMMSNRDKIFSKAREGRKQLTEEVDIDDASAEVLAEANRQLIGGSEEEIEAAKKYAEESGDGAGEDKGRDRKEARSDGDDKGVESEHVTVVVYGKEYSVPKADVERAGGVDAYQKQRAASVRMSEAAATQQRAQRMLQEAERRQRELEEREKQLTERSSRAGSEDPEPPKQGAHDENRDTDRKTRVKTIVNRIFSGNEEEAAAAIEDILSQTEGRKDVSPEAVAQMALRLFHEQQDREQQERRKTQEEQERARYSAEAREVNRMMRSEFSTIMDDPVRRRVAQAYFEEFKADPRNRTRALTDIARDAAEKVQALNIVDAEHERIVRRDEKRLLPSESSARRRAPAEKDTKRPATASEHIQRLRRHSGQSAQ